MPGSGISGSDVTKTMSETYTQTENGRKTEFKSSVAIKIKRVKPTERIVIKQMNDKDQVVEVTEITRDNIPDAIGVKADTAYMIAENYNGTNKIERTLLDPEENSYTCMFANDNGIMVGHSVSLVYNKSQDYIKDQKI